MANNVMDAAIRLRDLFTPTVRSVNASLGTMKTQMTAAKQSVSGLSDKLTEHERIQKRTAKSIEQTGSKISGLSDKMALLNHEAIISPQVFDWVQEEIKRRREGRGRYSGVSIFSSKIKCGQCGGWYGAKVWHSTDKYRRTIYRCNDKFKSHCKTPHLTEDDIKEAFVRAANRLIENKADVLDSIALLKERLTDTEALEEERDRLSTDLNLLAGKVQ